MNISFVQLSEQHLQMHGIYLHIILNAKHRTILYRLSQVCVRVECNFNFLLSLQQVMLPYVASLKRKDK